jgi:hypothetical protein
MAKYLISFASAETREGVGDNVWTSKRGRVAYPPFGSEPDPVPDRVRLTRRDGDTYLLTPSF